MKYDSATTICTDRQGELSQTSTTDCVNHRFAVIVAIGFVFSVPAEPPPPAELTATPLGDGSLVVRWRPPPDLSVSGFVVEWLAVREETSSVLHWEKLNSSSTKLIITGSPDESSLLQWEAILIVS